MGGVNRIIHALQLAAKPDDQLTKNDALRNAQAPVSGTAYYH
jgi:hypothetical protein